MKLVVNIPDDVYVRLFDNGIECNSDDQNTINIAIRKGEPVNDVVSEIKYLADFHSEKVGREYTCTFTGEEPMDKYVSLGDLGSILWMIFENNEVEE